MKHLSSKAMYEVTGMCRALDEVEDEMLLTSYHRFPQPVFLILFILYYSLPCISCDIIWFTANDGDAKESRMKIKTGMWNLDCTVHK